MRTWIIVIACFAAGYWVISKLMAANDSSPFSDAMRNPEGGAPDDTLSPENLGSDDRATASNWHTVLGVEKNAGKEAVRAAYKKQISLYHPDKVQLLGEEIRAVANKKAKQINAAYELATKYGRA